MLRNPMTTLRSFGGCYRVFLLTCAFALHSVPAVAQEPPIRAGEITSIRGDLYQVRDGEHVSVFLVTQEGIILVDPLSPELTRWLKTELEARFPGRPVRYVVHSSHRFERAAGADLYESADTVAHDNFPAARRRAATSLPAPWTSFDRNRNNILERSEAIVLGVPAWRDSNNNGEIDPAEAWGQVGVPDRTYGEHEVIELGGRRVELLHPGSGLGVDATVVLFPSERVLFAPGVPLHEVPTTFGVAPAREFVASLQVLERAPFDAVVSEKGVTGTLTDFSMAREYVESLLEGVRAGARRGDTVEQIQARLGLQQFSGLRGFDAQRRPNIAETYRSLRRFTVSVSGAAEFVHLQRGIPSCARGAPSTIKLDCQGVGGPTFAGAGSLELTVGRVGGAVEFSQTGRMTGSQQRFGSRAAQFEATAMAWAFMLRYEAVPVDRIGVVATGGLATASATQYVDALSSLQLGFRNSNTRARATIPVVGADVAMAFGKARVVAPVRMMRTSQAMYNPVGAAGPKWDMRVGVGISIPVFRSIR